MLKKAYKHLWVPIMGRILTVFIPVLEGRAAKEKPSYDIDAEKKKNLSR